MQLRLRSAASVISGNRPLQSWPLQSKPHALAVALHDQAVTVVLDLVQPGFPDRNLGAPGWDAGVEWRFKHGGKDRRRRQKCESQKRERPCGMPQ